MISWCHVCLWPHHWTIPPLGRLYTEKRNHADKNIVKVVVSIYPLTTLINAIPFRIYQDLSLLVTQWTVGYQMISLAIPEKAPKESAVQNTE